MHPYRQNRHAFTLVELLVVIAIISVLAALLLPALQAAHAEAMKVSCASRMRQVSMADRYYQEEFDDWLPGVGTAFRAKAKQNDANYDMTYWRELWPDDIRWCPTMQNDCSALASQEHPWPSPGQLNVPPPPWTQTVYYHTFGYLRPALDTPDVMKYFLTDLLSKDGAFGRTGRKVYARGWGGFYMTMNGEKVDVTDAQPVLSDIIFRPAATYRGVTAHNGGPSKFAEGTWIPPTGTNSLWLDGHVEWHPYRFGIDPVTITDYLYRNYGGKQPEEAYTGTGTSNYQFWTKRGK